MPAPASFPSDLSDDWQWGPPGELPPRLPFQPHHPPLLRRAAAAAAAVAADVPPAPRRHRLLPRGRSRVHTHIPEPRLTRAWDYGTQRMPLMFDERADWEAFDPAHSPIPARRRLATRPYRPHSRRRLIDFLGFRISRRRAPVARDDDDSLGLTYEELLELDDGNVRCGLSKDELDDLATFEATKEHMSMDCHICLERFEYGASLVMLSCDHVYHKHCIHTWLKQKRSCPICRCDL
ncbi:hypothetical protein FGB62_7g450 [Gracilaria domingensis]|nr:hypothetical protein FGB62_7g450 [Gracilaria domingensis]